MNRSLLRRSHLPPPSSRHLRHVALLPMVSVAALLAGCSDDDGTLPSKTFQTPVVVANAATQCAALSGKTIAAATIGESSSGAVVTAAIYKAAVADVPNAANTAIIQGMPDYCQVVVDIKPVDTTAPVIKAQMNLPTSWNGKSLQMGGGGLNGSLGTGLDAARAAGPETPLAVIHDTVQTACDALDGIADKVVSDYRSCRPLADAALVAKRCTSGNDEGAGCFSDAQINALRWVPRTQVFMMDMTNPDLSVFHARGGKLILREDLSDKGNSPQTGFDYYESVIARLGKDKVDQFFVAYGATGLPHTSPGLPAGTANAPAYGTPGHQDLLGLIDDWVVNGVKPPDSIALTNRNALPPYDVVASKPMCRYGSYPKYVGATVAGGNLAGNYACTAS